MNNSDPHCRVHKLTNEEWISDYEGSDANRYREAKGIQSEPDQGDRNRVNSNDELYFRYIDHRTTRKGSVALDFESLNGKIMVTAFFNVRLKNNRDKSYPAGKRGQFIPPLRGEFTKFWKEAVGEPPFRWCRVHKCMRSKLKGLTFTGDVTRELDGKNNPYMKIRNLRLTI